MATPLGGVDKVAGHRVKDPKGQQPPKQSNKSSVVTPRGPLGGLSAPAAPKATKKPAAKKDTKKADAKES